MTDQWTIEAKALPIKKHIPIINTDVTIAHHLYYEIWKPDGTRFMQINGFPTGPNGESIKPLRRNFLPIRPPP